MIFQDPLSHLNPVYSVGFQIAEVMTTHGVDRATCDAKRRLNCCSVSAFPSRN